MTLRRRRLLAVLGASLAGTDPARAQTTPNPAAPRFSLADFGGTPGMADAAPALAAALARLPPRGGAVLTIPPGTWRFARTQGAVASINGIENLTIEGAGARLLFNGVAKPFVFTGCQAPTVRGLTIDWQRPPFSQGEVVAVGQATADIQIDPAFPVDGSEVVRALGTYERVTGLTARAGLDAYDVVKDVALIGAQRLRLGFTRPLPLRPGDTVVLRHALYSANALAFAGCSGVRVEDVTIHSAPGMGVYADHCSGASVQRLRIALPDGVRLMTTTADGVHFNACSGTIMVEDCTMSRMGDDCVNVHGKYFKIVQRLDARTAVVAVRADRLAGPQHATPAGDRVEFAAAATLEMQGRTVVTSSQPGADGLTTLQFDRDLPPDVQAGDFVFDAETRSQASVLRCRFPGNRARGVLAHSDATVAGCSFAGQSAEAVLLLPDVHFMEGPAAEGVRIDGNTMAGVQRLGGRSGAIRVGVGTSGPTGATRPHPVNRDISVTNNHIVDVDGPAVLVRSSAGVRIAGNRIERVGVTAIVLDGVQDVRVTGNVCTPAGLVAVGPLDQTGVVMAGNVGLNRA